jgi:hypothetical protein
MTYMFLFEADDELLGHGSKLLFARLVQEVEEDAFQDHLQGLVTFRPCPFASPSVNVRKL